VAFIWAFPIFPTVDVPSHLYNAKVILKLLEADPGIYQNFYTLNTGLVTNWLSTMVLAFLLLFWPPLIAGKIVLTGYAVLLPLSIRYTVNGWRPGVVNPVVALSFPMVFSWFLYMGFLSFLYGFVFFFFFCGYWIRCRGEYGLRQGLILILLSLLLALWHVFSLGMAMFSVGVCSGWQVLLYVVESVRNGEFRFRKLLTVFKLKMIVPLMFFLPACLILSHYFLGFVFSKPGNWTPGHEVFLKLIMGKVLVVFGSWENLLSTAYVLLLVVLIFWVLSKKAVRLDLTAADGWFLVFIGFFVLCLVVPGHAGGAGRIKDRLALFSLAGCLIWLGAHSYERTARRLIRYGGVIIALGFLVLRITPMINTNAYLSEYMSLNDRIKPNSILLAFRFSKSGSLPEKEKPGMMDFTRHALAYVSSEKNCLNLWNYEPTTGYFPVRYRSGFEWTKELAGLSESTTGSFDELVFWLMNPERKWLRPDYLFVWGLPPQDAATGRKNYLEDKLGGQYELVAVSPGRGALKLFERKETLKKKATRP